MTRDVLLERFFNILINGHRQAARQLINQVLDSEMTVHEVYNDLLWPVLEQIQKLYRNDQMTELAHHYATRLMRSLADQLQLRLEQSPRNGRRTLVLCGPDEPEELACQMAADLLESEGFEVFFGGGGIANDEIVEQVRSNEIDLLMVFGALPSTVPATRLLIDHMHDIEMSPRVQIAVGGGVFNRADGLAEEIGADIWARTPWQMVQVAIGDADRRMTEDQRTVGRRRRTRGAEAA